MTPPRAPGSASGDRLPMKSGRTCSPSAISAACERPPARATMSFSSAASACGPARAAQFGKRRMEPQEMIDRRAERRLAAVDEPLIGGQRREMRSPHAVDESRLVRERHAAGRRAEDQRQAPARIGRPPCRARRPACPRRRRGRRSARRRPASPAARPSRRRPRPSVLARAAYPARTDCGADAGVSRRP